MRLPCLAAAVGVSLLAASLHASAEELKGAARRDYERTTSEGSLSTYCSAGPQGFAFWAGDAPSTLEVDGRSQPVQFERHKVGDYLGSPYRCQTSAGPLTLTTKLTHTISDSQCGAGNDFVARFVVAHVGSYSQDFLVDGCGGTSGVLIRGRQVLLCRMDDGGKAGVGQCAEATDGPGPRRLR